MKQFLLFVFFFASLQLSAQDYSIFDDGYLHEIRINSDDPNFGKI